VQSNVKMTSPVAWRDANLIGSFDFSTSSTPVDIEALAARYQDEDFCAALCRKTMVQNGKGGQFYPFRGVGRE
jgi:hypothetical protein